MKLTSKFMILIIGLFNISWANAANRLIIKYKPTSSQVGMLTSGKINKVELAGEQMKPLNANQVNRLSTLAGIKVRDDHAIGTGAHVIILNKNVDSKTLQSIISKIAKEPNIEYIEEDERVYPTAVPAINPVQWDMESISHNNTWYGANFTGGWKFLDNNNLVPGESIVVAVVDTGYTPHLNILSNLEPYAASNNSNTSSSVYGYQFISDCRTSGSCVSSTPDNQASISPAPNGLDLGDYLTQSQINASNGFFESYCLDPLSTWHGTHVTGTVVANGYDGESELLGGAYGAKVVPVRVLGKCGGYTSDVINGLLWAGNKYPGINNPNPAQVINLSLGGSGACGSFQSAIDEVSPAIVVVAAGNSRVNISTTSPANCTGIISVAALGPLNQLAYYSNYGATTIVAPGGDALTGSVGVGGAIYSTLWGSPQAYESTSGGDYDYYQGTSMASPHVAAAVADIVGYLKAHNESWTEAQIVQVLQNSASTDFDACSSYGCATQLKLDVEAALRSVAIESRDELMPSTDTVTFDATLESQTVSFANGGSTPIAIASYTVAPEDSRLAINATSCVGQTIAAGGTCNVIFTFTQTLGSTLKGNNLSSSESTTVVFRLVDANSINVSSITLTLPAAESTPVPPPVPPTPTPKASSGGGGGCAMIQSGQDDSLLILMLMVSILYLYRRKNNYSRSENCNEKHGGESK